MDHCGRPGRGAGSLRLKVGVKVGWLSTRSITHLSTASTTIESSMSLRLSSHRVGTARQARWTFAPPKAFCLRCATGPGFMVEGCARVSEKAVKGGHKSGNVNVNRNAILHFTEVFAWHCTSFLLTHLRGLRCVTSLLDTRGLLIEWDAFPESPDVGNNQ